MGSLFDSDAFNSNCFFPRADASEPPAGAQDFQVPVPGASLHLRWHRSLEHAPTVLLFHGNGEVVSDYDDASPWAALRLNLAICDFRGYGRSTGRPTLRSLIADAPVVAGFVGARTDRPVIVMGRSLGSACALALFGSAHPAVSGVVLESGFVDLDGLVRRRGLAPPARYTAEESSLFDPRPKVMKGRVPLLIIHGEEDRAIDAGEAREAHRLATTPNKRLALIPRRGHNDLSASPSYWEALAQVWTWPGLTPPTAHRA
ncbi:MAG: alpha/beta hydrolase [Archangium sp.]|nr:alpha/beta hydrolase [Archangium sp.]